MNYFRLKSLQYFQTAVCLHCTTTLARKGGTTGGMMSHLRSLHPEQYDLFLQQKMMYRAMKEEIKMGRTLKHSCNICDYQASTQGQLKIHIQSVHEKIKHHCDICDHHASTKSHLRRHIQSIHEKIKYSC